MVPLTGARLAYVTNAAVDSDCSLHGDVWTMDADGGNKLRLTDTGSGNYDPAWSN